MDDTQTMFHDFIMRRVLPGKEAQAETILSENFSQQSDGTTNSSNIEDAINQLKALMRPESLRDFDKATSGFKTEQERGSDMNHDEAAQEATTRLMKPDPEDNLMKRA